MRKVDLPELDRKKFAASYGPWAVIAGASEGVGACYAEALAGMGFNLVLVARRLGVLEALGEQLKAQHGVSYRAVVQDLMHVDAGASINEATLDLDVGLYISHAGSDGSGNSFLATPIERSQNLLMMNAKTVIDAVHAFGNRFAKRGGGGILLMTSGAGLGGQPWLAMYSATKGFEINFAESLWAEFQDSKIDIMALAAPSMDTPTLRKATAGSSFDVDEHAYYPAEVVHVALATLGQVPLLIFKDGPNEEKIPQLQAARLERLQTLAQWAKAYTETAKVE
jgi:short-subunit dehydrogenase